ncbi:hypothetical protein M6D93_14225 [Jatrophihabitans telluris]|uniref:Uncharacterized protein n=1 Tax=Jatrophihabitans telluris TaxID=2038343 RepID=A0ABY4QUX3_9ACTN|nr:hypothetical protein [Jatrophihabitans telluris]UQX87453.1 hypothetical protein M6D93_14225 [Jatrophihabitans telluris]
MTTTSKQPGRVDSGRGAVQPDPSWPAARIRTYRQQTSIAVFAAFALSAVYTVYLTAVGTADSSFDAMAPAAWCFYAVGFGLAALSRNTGRRSMWTVAIALSALIAVALFVYPATFTIAQQTTFGWFENDVYTGLLMLALYLSVQNLRGVVITSTPPVGSSRRRS